jgi:drug/metabolite transporter (DMT)-like permease
MCFAAIFVKIADAPGIITAFYRMAVGTVILAIPFFLSLRRSGYHLPKRGVVFAVLGGIFFGCDMSLWATGVVLSNATIPTLTANLAPLWVGFGTMILFRKRLKTGFWLGLGIAVSGMFLLMHRDLSDNLSVRIGALLGLGAGLFYGMFYLVSERGRKFLSTIQFLFIFTLSSAVVLLLFSVLFGYPLTGYDRNTYIVFLAIGVLVQVCGWFLISYSQGYLPATTVAPILLGQPVLTFFLATLLLKEKLSPVHIIGGLIVVAGIYLVHYSRNK